MVYPICIFYALRVLMLLSKVKSILQKSFPDADFNIYPNKDNHKEDHLTLEILKPGSLLSNQDRIEQDRMIFKALNGLIGGELHALQIRHKNEENFQHVSIDCNESDSVIHNTIRQIINSKDIVLFMKGTKTFPRCGYSGRVVSVLNELNVDFKDIDVLSDDSIRQGVKTFSDWPTIPQLYIKQKFIGGSDIVLQIYKNGDLQKLISEI